jgi:hypothetical protein
MASRAIGDCLNGKLEAKLVPVTAHRTRSGGRTVTHTWADFRAGRRRFAVLWRTVFPDEGCLSSENR